MKNTVSIHIDDKTDLYYQTFDPSCQKAFGYVRFRLNSNEIKIISDNADHMRRISRYFSYCADQLDAVQ